MRSLPARGKRVDLTIANRRFPIADSLHRRASNRQLAIGNDKTHPPPRAGNDLGYFTRLTANPVLYFGFLASDRSCVLVSAHVQHTPCKWLINISLKLYFKNWAFPQS